MNTKSIQFILTIILGVVFVSQSTAQEIGLQIVEGKDVLFGDSTNNQGARLMWLDSKKSFRAGVINIDCTTCWDLTSIGMNSFGFGKNSMALGEESAAWGDQTQATQYASTAWGSFTESKGSRSTAWGHNTKALANRSTSWGNGTTASHQESTAWGRSTVASGLQSTAWGNTTIASGEISTVWGASNEAQGAYSTAWGDSTTAVGSHSTAWGKETIASGVESTAWGSEVIASGNKSTAWGEKTTAPSSHETVFGKYNTEYVPINPLDWNEDDRLFVIGNGKSKFSKSDALVLKKNGYLGIGKSNPEAVLHLRSNLKGDSTGIKITNGSTSSFIHHDANDNLVIFQESLPKQLVLNDDGWIGMGTDGGTHPLELSSGAHCDEDGVWVNASDVRLKREIVTSRYGINEILKLNPVDYKMKKSGTSQVGFIAQEVLQVIPEVVSGFEGDLSKNETLGISYGNLVAVLVSGMQEQQDQLEKQKTEIELQKVINDKLKTDNANLLQRMDKIESIIRNSTKE